MGKRNKKTTIVANPALNQLTEQILRQMGPEGEAIRDRLLRFLQERLVLKPSEAPEVAEPPPKTP